MRVVVFVCFFVFTIAVQAQDKFEWREDSALSMNDFLGTGTAIGQANLYMIQPGVLINFSYQMTNAEFMMTKNWNEKVNCTFDRKLSYIVAPNDSVAKAMIRFAQFEFDLAELNCRKLRKSIFEEKKWNSSSSMFQPLYDRTQKDFLDVHTKVSKETDLGLKEDILKLYHAEVLAQIKALPDFCRTCKPSKKKS